MHLISFDATPQELLPSLLTWLLLCSQICPTSKHSTIIDATLQDLRIILPRFYHHRCYALRSSCQSPNCTLCETGSEASCTQFVPCERAVARSVGPETGGNPAIDATDLQFSTIIEATVKDLLVTFYPRIDAIFF